MIFEAGEKNTILNLIKKPPGNLPGGLILKKFITKRMLRNVQR